MNTRQYDLDQLEERGASKKKLDEVYRQTKNIELESLRKRLIEAHKRGDIGLVERIEQAIRNGRW